MMRRRMLTVSTILCMVAVLLFNQSSVTNAADKIQGNGPNEELIFDPQLDYDDDGITNGEEDKLGLFIFEADSDFDSFPDGEEKQKYGTDPTKRDTDGDGLNDLVEVIDFQTDPLNADENNNSVIDGMEERTYSIPKNDFGITGTVKGVGPISRQFSIEKNPIILLDQIKNLKLVHLQSLNQDLTFHIEIPFTTNTEVKDPYLFKYEYRSGQLTPVQQQKLYSGKIEASVNGGGVLVVASMSDYKKSLVPQHLPKIDVSQSKLAGKIHIANIPGLTVDADRFYGPSKAEDHTDIDRTGVITFTRSNQFDFAEEKSKTLSAEYKMEEIYSDGQTHYVTLTSVSTESGNQPTIMVHGLNGSTGTWGYENYWDNGEANPDATSNISSSCTFTGKSYSDGTVSTYNNIDVHYICSRTDNNELGSQLDIDFAYTPNVDLFGFEYHHDGHVETGADHLGTFIDNLRSYGIIGSSQDVNLMAHSKGGLISRYLIENLSGSVDVDRLLTWGTPHFGSDLSTFGDMDREDSDLWNGNNIDSVCETFTNSHTYTHYFTVGGFEPWTWDINDTLRGFHDVGNLSTSYDQDVRNRFANAGEDVSGYGDIGDGWVDIDSAEGSDQDPDFNGTRLANLNVNNRFYIFHETYGDHSGMRKHPDSDNYAAGILAGNFDY